MIVYERDDVWVMTAQDDHARFSGAAAGFWKDESLTGSVLYEDVRLAIQEHDRGWIPLDVHPMWNDREQRPYSFRDLPVGLKLPYYRQGVDEVQERNEYAALLNSLHYASFFHEDRIGGLGDIEKDGVDRFLAWEQQRRGAIKAGNGWTGEEAGKDIAYHLEVLQFCDTLSLFVSLQEPGEPLRFYAGGFAETFHFLGRQKIRAGWEDRETVRLTPSPLVEGASGSFRFKEVPKASAREKGIAAAYRETPWRERMIRFTGA